MPVTEAEFDALLAGPTLPPVAPPATTSAISPGGSMSEADFDAFLQMPGDAAITSTTPLTNNAFSLAHADARAKADSSRRNKMVGGLPVGSESDLDMPFLENLAAGREVSGEGRLRVWQKFYGEKNVITDSDGDIFIIQTRKDGTKQAVPVNEAGPSLADAAKLALMVPELAASIRGGARAQSPGTGLPPTLGARYANLLRQSVGGAAGTAAASSALQAGGEGTLAEDATAIGLNAGVEALSGLTIGQATMLPRRVGEWMGWGSSKAVKEASTALRGRLAGTMADETVTRESVGNELIDAVGARGVQAREASRMASEGTVRAARMDIGDAMTRSTSTAASLTRQELGSALSTRVVDARDAWKAADGAVFEAVKTDPRAQAFVLQPKGLLKEVEDMRANLASVKKTRSVQAPIPGTIVSGTQQVTTAEPVAALNVIGILGKLDAVLEMKGGEVRLQDLMTARTAIGEAIAMGEAVPGTHTGAMNTLYGKLTKAIGEGFDDLGAADLKTMWKDAVDSYKVAAGFFEQPAFKRAFKEGPQAVAPEEIVASFMDPNKGPEVYRAFGKLLRPAEMSQVKRAVADELTGLALDPTRNAIATDALGTRLKTFAKANPEMASDVFGGELPGILATLDAAAVAQGKIKPQDLANALGAGAGPLTQASVRKMIAAQAVESRTFANAVVKRATEGVLDPTTITPSQFVENLVYKTTPSNFSEVMKDVTDPGTLQRWKQATVTDIMDSAMDDTGAIKKDALLSKLGTPMSDSATNLRAILGADAEDLLRKMATDARFHSRMGKFVEKVLPAMVTTPFVAFRYRYLSARIMGTLLSDDVARGWIKNMKPGDRPPRLGEVHIANLIAQALDLGATPTNDDATPTPTSP